MKTVDIITLSRDVTLAGVKHAGHGYGKATVGQINLLDKLSGKLGLTPDKYTITFEAQIQKTMKGDASFFCCFC
jgi:hypothetical protein